jgi:hypothetical protein
MMTAEVHQATAIAAVPPDVLSLHLTTSHEAKPWSPLHPIVL